MTEETKKQPTKHQHDSLFYRLEKIPMPEESFGACKYVKRCKNWNVILGNGLCVRCWDKGLDKGYRKSVKRMKEEGVKDINNILEFRKTHDDGNHDRTYTIG